MKTHLTLLFLLFGLSATVSGAYATNPVMTIPANDLIENAIDLDQGPFPYSELSVNFPEATNTNDPTGNPSCDLIHPGIWYKFTATSAGTVAALVVNPTNAWVIFFSAPDENVTDGSELTHVDVPTNSCGGGNSKTIETEPGTTYYIYMKNTIISDVLININPALTPENDLIENAVDLNEINDLQYLDEGVQFQFATNTNDGGEIDCDTGSLEGVWYKLYSHGIGNIISQMGFDPGDSVITTYSAPNGNITQASDLVFVDVQDNTCGFSNYSEVATEAGMYYYIFAYSQHVINSVVFQIDGDILGTNENSIEGFIVYPNPVSDVINISAKTNIDQISIFNLLGQNVYSEKINNTKTGLNLSFLKQGMYVMTVTSEGNSASYKIVKK